MSDYTDECERLRRDTFHQDKKKELIKALAEFLVTDAIRKSIELQMKKPDAVSWARLRTWSSITGDMTVEQAIEALRRDLR